ncbi:MAG TPA: hypothetical protein VG225_01915 [Terracidiphilus sp.]|jgi:hypothetical protein|nr:hypothetical protein [Terracidiphilus sp.]
MNRLAILFALAAVLTTSTIAQSAVAAPSTAACPTTTTLDELTKALDDAVSGPGNKDRACLRDLLLPDARLTPVARKPDGSFVPRMLTVDDWINAVAKRGSAVFYERQIKVQSESYGHFAHLWSTYEIRDTPDGKASVTGINSVQAVNDGKRWRVIGVLWEPDTTAGPVPRKYLP